MKVTVNSYPTTFTFGLYIAQTNLDYLENAKSLDPYEVDETVILKNSFLIIKSTHFNKMVEILQSGIINPYPSELLEYGELDENVFYTIGAIKQLAERSETGKDLPKRLISNVNLIFHLEDKKRLSHVHQIITKTLTNFKQAIESKIDLYSLQTRENLQKVNFQLNIFYAVMYSDLPVMRKAFLRFENGLTEDLYKMAGFNAGAYEPLKRNIIE